MLLTENVADGEIQFDLTYFKDTGKSCKLWKFETLLNYTRYKLPTSNSQQKYKHEMQLSFTKEDPRIWKLVMWVVGTIWGNADIFFYSMLDLREKCIRSFSGPYFPSFRMNTERYGISLRIQKKCEKIRTRKNPNTNTFHAVLVLR